MDWKHNARDSCENWHKELKLALGMEQTPCGQFEANAMYFALVVLGYNLAQLLERRVLPESYHTATVATRASGPFGSRPTSRNGGCSNRPGCVARRWGVQGDVPPGQGLNDGLALSVGGRNRPPASAFAEADEPK